MYNLARSPHFIVNSTNDRIVLNTTILSCPLRNQFINSVSYSSVREWSDSCFTLAKNKKHTVVAANHHSVIKPKPTKPNPWMYPIHVRLWFESTFCYLRQWVTCS